MFAKHIYPLEEAFVLLSFLAPLNIIAVRKLANIRPTSKPYLIQALTSFPIVNKPNIKYNQ